jgi:nucleoside-diphosphate-sugar epimerase
MKIVVTGVTGFLGGHLASALVDDGHTVVGTGRDRKRAELARKRGASVLLGDIAEKEFVCEAIAGAEAVVHAAALSAPWGSRQAFLTANVTGTENVVEACRRYLVQRVVHVSSPSVTFAGQDVFQQTEQAPYPRRYLSFYSQSKKMAEDVVNHAIRAGLPATIVRPKAIFGPGDTTLLPRLIAAARAKRLVQVGTGTNLVDLTHVANVVRSIVLVLKTEYAVGQTYTITNDEPSNLWSVIRLAVSEILAGANLRRVPYRAAFLAATAYEARAALTRREPFLTRYSVAILGRNQTYDISALKRDTGYTPGISIKEGLRQTIAAFKAEDSSGDGN